MIGLTIPTRGDRPYLPGIIEASGLPSEQIFVVVTTERPVFYAATIVRDLDEVNIHRWWNTGIDLAVMAGCDHVAVFNDDLIIEPGLLTEMSLQLTRTGASICYTATARNRNTGWAYMINASHGIRPNECFRWWYGDNDLHDQAEAAGGTTAITARVQHMHPNELTQESPELLALADSDRITYYARRATRV